MNYLIAKMQQIMATKSTILFECALEIHSYRPEDNLYHGNAVTDCQFNLTVFNYDDADWNFKLSGSTTCPLISYL